MASGQNTALREDIEAPEPSQAASVSRLATMVRRARERRGWSQAVLAETAHVAHDVIYRLEAGKSDPPFSLVADLTRILGLPIDRAVFNQRVARQVQEAAQVEEDDCDDI